jgi:hypothetical protein
VQVAFWRIGSAAEIGNMIGGALRLTDIVILMSEFGDYRLFQSWHRRASLR